MIRATPTDTQPVFEAIVQSGLKLFPTRRSSCASRRRQAACRRFADTDPVRAKALLRRWPVPLTCEYNHAIAILDRRMIDIPEARDAPSEFATGDTSDDRLPGDNYHADDADGDAIGALSVVRAAPGALSDSRLRY